MNEILSKVLAKVVGKQTEIQKQTTSVYVGIVAKIADGREPDADQVLAVLRDTGKTADDLAADVELLVKRRGWAKLAAERTTHETTMTRVDAEVAKLEAAHKIIVEKHQDAVRALDWQKTKAIEGINAAADAQRRLSETCADADIHAELTEGRREQSAAAERKTRAERELDRAKNNHYSLVQKREQGRAIETGAIESAAAFVERSRNAVTELEREIDERQQRIDAAFRRLLVA